MLKRIFAIVIALTAAGVAVAVAVGALIIDEDSRIQDAVAGGLCLLAVAIAIDVVRDIAIQSRSSRPSIFKEPTFAESTSTESASTESTSTESASTESASTESTSDRSERIDQEPGETAELDSHEAEAGKLDLGRPSVERARRYSRRRPEEPELVPVMDGTADIDGPFLTSPSSNDNGDYSSASASHEPEPRGNPQSHDGPEPETQQSEEMPKPDQTPDQRNQIYPQPNDDSGSGMWEAVDRADSLRHPDERPPLDPATVNSAVESGRSAVVKSMVADGSLSSEGPILDADVPAMVFVAFIASELRKIILAGGSIDGSDISNLDLGDVDLFPTENPYKTKFEQD